MTSDEIIRIAKAVRLGEVDEDGDIWCSDGFYTEEIDSFAQLVATAAERKAMEVNSIHSCHSECQRPMCVAVREAVAAEREACAKLLDEMAAADRLSNYYKVAALRIRERGAP